MFAPLRYSGKWDAPPHAFIIDIYICQNVYPRTHIMKMALVSDGNFMQIFSEIKYRLEY